jgi:hypothetical protein
LNPGFLTCPFHECIRIEIREFLDIARLDEFFDHTGLSSTPGSATREGLLTTQSGLSMM